MDKKEWTDLAIFVAIVILVGALFIQQTRPAVHPAKVEGPEPAFNAGSESTANMLMEAAVLLMDPDVAEMERLDHLGWSDTDQADLQAFLGYKARVFDLLMQASAMPPADFGMVTQKSSGIVEMLPHFRRLLRLEARTLTVNGLPDSADKVMGASAALARALLHHPPEVKKSVGIANKALNQFRGFRAWFRRAFPWTRPIPADSASSNRPGSALE